MFEVCLVKFHSHGESHALPKSSDLLQGTLELRENSDRNPCDPIRPSNPLTAKTRFLDIDFAAEVEEHFVMNRCCLSQVCQFLALGL
jgi:hypothetical protein